MRIRAAAMLIVVIGLALGVAFTAGGAVRTKSARTHSAASAPIVIGYSVAKTGPFEPYDGSLENGGKMAAAAINAKGGVLHRKLKIIDCDTKTSINNSAPCAKQVISQGAQFVVSTSDYDYGGPALRVATGKGLVGIGFAGDPKLGYHGIGPLAFNSYQGSPAEGTVDAEFAFSKGWKKPYTLTDTINSYPKTVTDWFVKRWKELTGKGPVGQDVFLNSDPSIATQITRIKQANPDVIILTSFPPGGASAIKQIRGSGINTPIVGDEAFDGSYWISAIPNLSNVYNPKLASPDGNDPSRARNAFFKAYKKFTGKASILASYPAMGYAQIQILAKGITDAKSTNGKRVAAAISKLTNYSTLIGLTTYSWRKRCNVVSGRPFLIYQVQNGKESFLRAMTPKHVPPFVC
jgi:branched-chain amino acid transport system substrate-binding protein